MKRAIVIFATATAAIVVTCVAAFVAPIITAMRANRKSGRAM